MSKRIEISFKVKSIISIENPDVILQNFIKYLDEKYPAWEDFILTNKFEKQIRVIKHKSDLEQVSKTLSIGNLISHLDKVYKDWDRIAISKIKFTEIRYDECEIGMLVRASTSNTCQYIYIDQIQFNSKGEKELICQQEGQKWVANTVNMKDYKFSLLSSQIDKEKFVSIDWPVLK